MHIPIVKEGELTSENRVLVQYTENVQSTFGMFQTSAKRADKYNKSHYSLSNAHFISEVHYTFRYTPTHIIQSSFIFS